MPGGCMNVIDRAREWGIDAQVTRHFQVKADEYTAGIDSRTSL
jgi:hypothetical protein